MSDLRPHGLKVVLVQPQIAPNTGNIGRLCVATGTALHLVRPLGFVLNDAMVKRSGLDYWPRLKPVVHDDEAAFLDAVECEGGAKWLFSSKGDISIWDVPFGNEDWLIFGSETHGLSDRLRTAYPHNIVRIPQVPLERCLNLSTAAGIGLYEALRQVHLSSRKRPS